jgi:L-arabinose isomerase
MVHRLVFVAGVELLVIDAGTNVRAFRHELKWNETDYGLRNGFIS